MTTGSNVFKVGDVVVGRASGNTYRILEIKSNLCAVLALGSGNYRMVVGKSSHINLNTCDLKENHYVDTDWV